MPTMPTADAPLPPAASAGRWTRPLQGLPARLLLLTIAFVMLSEVFIFLPSVANFRVNWLRDRVRAASVAAVAAKAAPDGEMPEMLKTDLLRTAGLRGIVLRTQDRRRPILIEYMPPAVDATYDLRTTGFFDGIYEALAVLGRSEDRMIRAIDASGMGSEPGAEWVPADEIEIVVSEGPLRTAMRRWGLNILGLSILISLFTASLVFVALYGLLVRPLQRMTADMMRFAGAPEAPGAVIVPSDRRDEIGIAERELARMQGEIQALLKERSRLASLGLAVSKINHDLRNILANAHLISDRLASVKDPTVQRMTPKLIASLDRAARLCTDTLQFGRSSEPAPRRELLHLAPVVAEVGENLGLPRTPAAGGGPAIGWRTSVPSGLTVSADPDQLHRILSNLVRNALQVLEGEGAGPGPHAISVTAARSGTGVRIEVRDTGPGVPAMAQAKLFQPFQGARPGGTGLGLAIVAELVRGHGGTVMHLAPASGGALFRLDLPDVPADAPRPAGR